MHIWLPLVLTGTGAEVYTRRLARRLTERGHRVTLDPVAHRYQYAPWLAPIRCPRDADVILANSWSAAAFAPRGVPLVSVCHLVVHDPALARFKSRAQAVFHRRFVLPMERAALRRAAANIAVSETVRQQMLATFGPAEIDVVLNGVDTEFFTPGPLPERAAGAPLELLFVGKPSLRKGFDLVAEILARLGGRARFTCVGDPPGPDLPRPEGDYTGRQDEAGVRARYRAADLLLFPSRVEGAPYVVLEAMACGLPVIACDGTAVAEIMPGRAGGILRAPQDVAGFAQAIAALGDDPARLRAMRLAAREHAVAALSETAWAARTEAVLARVARPGTPP